MITTNNKNFVWNETIGYITKYLFQNTLVRCVAATAYISPSFANCVFDIFNTRHNRSESVVKCGLGHTNPELESGSGFSGRVGSGRVRSGRVRVGFGFEVDQFEHCA